MRITPTASAEPLGACLVCGAEPLRPNRRDRRLGHAGAMVHRAGCTWGPRILLRPGGRRG